MGMFSDRERERQRETAGAWVLRAKSSPMRFSLQHRGLVNSDLVSSIAVPSCACLAHLLCHRTDKKTKKNFDTKLTKNHHSQTK